MSNKYKISEAGLTWFFSITENEWHLSEDEKIKLLGCLNKKSYLEWKENKATLLPDDIVNRLSYLYRIYKVLNFYFKHATILEWLNNKNSAPLFAGRTPLNYMMVNEADALALVIDYLENPEFCRET